MVHLTGVRRRCYSLGVLIEEMPLYATIRRVDNELIERGLSGTGRLSAEQLFPVDQIHYHGTAAVQRAVDVLPVGRSSRLVEIGSGLGGPARYMAHVAGGDVTAIELQPALHERALTLTRRCGLDARVHHVLGDALTCPLAESAFDAAVSWLAIHHIPGRSGLLQRIATALRPRGRLYVEDLYVRTTPDADAAAALEQLLYGVTMTGLADYERELAAAGFVDILIEDMSDDWGRFCASRAASWHADRERQTRVHGDEIFTQLDAFFAGVARLFASGAVGGARIIATRA
jgi:cyclopropane fatty-acyl-phospholipid synthase-like methyltransferase